MAVVLYDSRGNLIYIPATSGGRGSFSYADTKVFGPREPTKLWIPRRYSVNTNTGQVTVTEDPATISQPMLGGGGGGAKAPGKRWYGSKATGFKPQGLVLLRLMKLG